MSWQEDLHQLDTALAGGQISADDYRRRRDELLAKASGGTPDQSTQGSPAGQPSTPPPGFAQPATPPPGFAQPSTPPPGFAQPSTPPPGTPPPGFAQPGTPPPGTPQPNQGYFPPPFRWETARPQQQQPVGPAEETQTMRPVGQDADRTQVVPGSPATGDRTQAIQGRPGDRTQVVQQGFGQQPGAYNAQQQYYTDGPGWQGGQGQEPTPWGGSEFPPLGPTGNWGVKQGPEVFGTGGGGKGKRTIAIVAAVVVLVLIGGGVYYFTSGHGGGKQQPQAGPTAKPTTTTPKPRPTPANPDEPLIDQIPPVVGTVNPRGQLIDTSDLVQMQVTDQTVVGLLTQAGVQQVAWRAGSKAPDQYGPTRDYFSVIVIPQDSADAADSLAQQIQHYQEDNGMTAVKPAVPGVPSTIVFEKHTAPSLIDRGLWVCGDDVVWVNVDQQPATDDQALTKSFQREIVSLTQSFPAQ